MFDSNKNCLPAFAEVHTHLFPTSLKLKIGIATGSPSAGFNWDR
jgi:predicted amidohydrolase YtcJ